MSGPLVIEGSYSRAVDYSNKPDNHYGSDKGLFGNIAVFGRRLVIARLYFAESTVEAAVDTIYNLALTLFRTATSATIGILFIEKARRQAAFSALEHTVESTAKVLKSAIGVLCPWVVDRFIGKDGPKLAPAS